MPTSGGPRTLLKLLLVAALGAALALLAACGSSSDKGSKSSPTSSAGSGSSPADGGGADVAATTLASCAANITVQNVAFYGDGTASTKSDCAGVTPPTRTIMGAPFVVEPTTGGFDYGVSPYIWSTFTGQSPGQSTPTLNLATSTGALTIAGRLVDPEDGSTPYMFAGLASTNPNHCVNASQYAGVTFEVSGSHNGCRLSFAVNDSEHSSPVYDRRATCTEATCYGPSFTVPGTGTVTVPFTEFTSGSPNIPLDSASILGIQWNWFIE